MYTTISFVDVLALDVILLAVLAFAGCAQLLPSCGAKFGFMGDLYLVALL